MENSNIPSLLKTISTVSTNSQPRVLIPSLREIREQAANACLYEFEDVISSVDHVDLLNLKHDFPHSRRIYRLAKYGTKSEKFASAVASFSPQLELQRDYDLLFLILDNPWQTWLLNGIKNWRDRCRFVACYIVELWEKDLEDWQLLQGPFENLDHIFLGHNHCVDALSKRINRPCSYLPPAVDAGLFSPLSLQSIRGVDVCYIGRRSPEVHRSLKELMSEQDFFYYYDTASRQKLNIDNPKEHRMLLANLFKRSRYTVVHFAKFNRPESTGGEQEIGYRFFEGAAAGTVMLGTPPKTEIFRQLFDWPDAVIDVDVDNGDIVNLIADLDAKPELLARIRRDNVVNALQRHDWLHRWRQVLATLNLPQTSDMQARDQYLKGLSKTLLGAQDKRELSLSSIS